jgi:hypothetical protein
MDRSRNTKYPEVTKNAVLVDEQDELLHATDNSHDNCYKTGIFAMVAKLLG